MIFRKFNSLIAFREDLQEGYLMRSGEPQGKNTCFQRELVFLCPEFLCVFSQEAEIDHNSKQDY